MSKPSRRSPKQSGSYRRRKPSNLFPERPLQSSDASSASQHHSPQQIEFLIKLGIEAFQSRRLPDALEYLEKALALDPGRALAHNCLGLVHRAGGNMAQAVACYQRALHLAPDYAEAHNNLGVVHESLGDLRQAESCYRAALQAKPHFAAALNNLGNVLTKLGQAPDAVKCLQKVLSERPDFAAAHNNLGLALSRLNRLQEAEQSFRRALECQPNFPEAYVNLGNLLRAKQQFGAAAECYRAAVQWRPRYGAAWSGLGNVLLEQRQPREALAAFDQAVQIDALAAEAHFGRGNVFLELEQWNDAESCYRRALECDSNYGEAWNNLGSACRSAGRFDDAEAAFRSAVRVNPDLVAAHNNLGNLYRMQDRLDLAGESYRQVLKRQSDMPLASLRTSTLCPAVFGSRAEMENYQQQCLHEWSSLREAYAYEDLSDLLTVANEVPYNLQFFAEDIRPLKEAYAAIFRYRGPQFDGWPVNSRIRIGCIVTAGHEIAFLRLIWDALRRMDRAAFEPTILCAAESVAKFQQAIGDDPTPIVAISEQPRHIVDSIRRQRFDIVYYFEIGTDARNYFLPYLRLAPVQVTSWGIQVTSGIPQVDYYLSSGLVEAPDADAHYSERLVRARTLLTYQRRMSAPEHGKSREAFGISRDEHLYLCAQHLGKFHPDFDVVMAEILRRDPRGRIVGTEDKNGYGAKKLRERWNRDIPDVASRIVLLPRLNQGDYLSLLAAGDVMLDPIHFGGVSTTYDGLSLDIPIVTLPSRYHRGRYTAGCLTRLGLTRCIARDIDDYIGLALTLGGDRSAREQVSREIHEQSWRIFEDAEAVTEHERIFYELVGEGTKR